jgi:hypothetical protein
MKTKDELCEIFGCTPTELAKINPADVLDALSTMYPGHYSDQEAIEIKKSIRDIREDAFIERAVAQQPLED